MITTGNEIDRIVASLRGAADVNEACATVDKWNRDNRTRDLLDLAAAIERGCDVAGALRFPYEALADHVEEVLALSPGRDHIDALLALLAKERVNSVQRPRPPELRVRAFASRLGHGQTKEVLLSTIASDGRDPEREEILACWMHETVLRGTALDREDAAVAFHAHLSRRGHPLGAMPLALLSAEAEAPTYMPMYGANAIQSAVERLESGPTSARTIPPPSVQQPPRVTRLPDEALERRMLEAVVPWTTGSNGAGEAKLFQLDKPLGNEEPGKWLLRALPLDCLNGADSLRAEVVAADAVWGALFAAASNGGAFSTGLGGAYGRRAAWRSLAALADAPADATPAEVDSRAADCRFLMFGAPGDWLHDVAWDIGILTVRPGGASVAVLAATDTD